MTAYLKSLSLADLREASVPEPWSYGYRDSVRYGEIDMLGHVNNAVYLKWFENLRVTYFNDRNIPIIGARQTIVLRKTSVEFDAEVKLGESYILTGRTVEIRNTSFIQNYGVWVDGQLRTKGEAVIVVVGPNGKEPLSDEMRSIMIKTDGAVQV